MEEIRLSNKQAQVRSGRGTLHVTFNCSGPSACAQYAANLVVRAHRCVLWTSAVPFYTPRKASLQAESNPKPSWVVL